MMSSDAQASSFHRLPRAFGRYTLFDFIGKGGMAEIYLARATTDLGGARYCVVKRISPEFADNPRFSEMLIHEAKLAAQLNHAHVAQVFDLGQADDELFIAMEYVEGFDLNALLRRCSKIKEPMPLMFALRTVQDALKGLDYAHRRTDDTARPLGIVHRDVSPSNILISFEGEVKLCDFGIARANDAMTSPGKVDEAIKGKAGYMSPEHARGESVDNRADIFALGIVLWELLAGRRMYRQEPSKPSLLEQARRAITPPLALENIPKADQLRRIVTTALAPNREERYASSSLMLRDLEQYILDAELVVSPLKFGEWLHEKFGADLVRQRRMRDRAAQALARGPALVLTPISREADAGAHPEPDRASLEATSVDVEGVLAKTTKRVSDERRGRYFMMFWLLLILSVGILLARR